MEKWAARDDSNVDGSSPGAAASRAKAEEPAIGAGSGNFGVGAEVEVRLSGIPLDSGSDVAGSMVVCVSETSTEDPGLKCTGKDVVDNYVTLDG